MNFLVLTRSMHFVSINTVIQQTVYIPRERERIGAQAAPHSLPVYNLHEQWLYELQTIFVVAMCWTRMESGFCQYQASSAALATECMRGREKAKIANFWPFSWPSCSLTEDSASAPKLSQIRQRIPKWWQGQAWRLLHQHTEKKTVFDQLFLLLGLCGTVE